MSNHCIVVAIAHTHTTFLRSSIRDYPGEPVPEATFTHSHRSCSPAIFYQLRPSTVIHSILLAQITCLTVCTTSIQVLCGLPLGLEPSASYSIHFFTQSLSSFCNACPYHRSLFCCSSEIISSVRSLTILTICSDDFC